MIQLFSKNNCPACKRTKVFLNELQVAFEEHDIEKDSGAFDLVLGLGYQSVPVVMDDNGGHWAGYQPAKLMQLKN